MPQATTPRPNLRPWYVWLAAFYAAWAFVVFGLGHTATALAHWPIAVAMAAGSYAAGSTPMGGGTVAFPILVLLFGESPQLGRDFSFAAQSVGMVSATLFVLARRQPLAWPALRGALAGSTLGVPIGVLLVAPHVSALWIKLVFATLWGSFGVLHLWRIGSIAAQTETVPADAAWAPRAGFVVGLLSGATVVAVAGVGTDMMLYTALVLLGRADLRIAIPTAVCAMAWASVVGLVTKLATGGLQPGVFAHWLAAAPVVVVGAPFGAFVVARIGRKPTLAVVAVLCVGQLFGTLHSERATLGVGGVLAALAAVGACLFGFEALRRRGTR
ncbi:MAG: sulfite exporter TauE/SafE family protein [Planctomycetes bacterium]|nr:sulfite exporter TauE/SafE family protein [Planctomycetota bacterium]